VVLDCAGTHSALQLASEITGWRARIVIEGARRLVLEDKACRN